MFIPTRSLLKFWPRLLNSPSVPVEFETALPNPSTPSLVAFFKLSLNFEELLVSKLVGALMPPPDEGWPPPLKLLPPPPRAVLIARAMPS